MKVKKNASADLGKYSTIFFQIGLILVLATTYGGLEWQFNERDDSFSYDVGNFDEDMEIIPITNINTPPPPPPPPPPAAPEILKIVEDETDTKEDIIQSTESNQDAKIQVIVPISAIVEAEVEKEEIADVPFFIVEQIPLYPGCENIKNKEEQIKCMNEKIKGLFGKEFNIGIAKQMDLMGVQKIYVVFKIDKTGEVVDIRSRGPNVRLEAEAGRVAKLLPRMTPGTQRGKPVAVTYTLPVIFEIRPEN